MTGLELAHILIWLSLAFLFYVHIGYPLVLLVWSKMARRRVRKAFWEPHVSIVIAVHNERDIIEEKIQNCLQLDYPPDRLQVVLSLDAPTDGTDAVVEKHRGERVRVVSLSQHKGKAGALNHGVPAATGDILV